MNRALDVATSYLATLARVPAGMLVGELGPRPEKPLELYEFEACPYCRKVREALTMLDLQAMIYPCPKKGPRFRKQVVAKGGKAQFPYLVDPNTGEEMYESDDIVAYLYDNYGNGRVPIFLSLGRLTTLSASFASAYRLGRGREYRPARAPKKPLELYSFELSPYSRLAREALCELEIPYLLHNVGKKSPSRPDFEKRSGKVMVPYLVDPNTDTEMFESADIVAYLERTYAKKTR
jgi:glutathione S-transferase